MTLATLDWEKLVKDFKNERCILMLGPRIAGLQTDGQLNPLVEELALHLTNILQEYNVDYEKSESRRLSYISQCFLRISSARRVDLEDIAREFFLQHSDKIPGVYKLIAELPAKIIINTTPDNFAVRALQEAGKRPLACYYNFQVASGGKRGKTMDATQIDIDGVSVERPLVYNLFGTLEDTESMVLTETDQMDFIRNVVKGNPPLPDELLGQFDYKKTYVFLGFNMEHWHFRLLLDSLNLREDNLTLAPQTDNYPITNTTRAFYEERFNFHFIEEEIEKFTRLLHSSLVKPKSEKRQSLFIAFADEDIKYVEELENWLKPMVQRNEFEIWHKGKLGAGEMVDEKIRSELEKADCILLLMSTDFLASDQIFERELTWSIQEYQNRLVQLIPVVARACDWRANRDLRALSPLPEDGVPIENEKWRSRDDAFNEIVQNLKRKLQP